jgi:TRAP-type C4-dicarboxylate transport system permease small subunit
MRKTAQTGSESYSVGTHAWGRGETIMQKSVSGIIKKVSLITDKLAGVCFFSVMVLVLANIIMRNVFKHPILGTVEIVGLLIATGLGLALANCEMTDFNISMDIVTEKLSRKKQKVISIVIYLISLSFWAIVVWRIFIYENTSYINGRVTSTASIPIYPIIFILGFNVFCLCVALAYKLIRTIMDAPAEFRKPAREGKEESK